MKNKMQISLSKFERFTGPMPQLLSVIRLFSTIVLVLLFSDQAKSQQDTQLPYTEISSIKFAEDIWKSSKIFYANKQPGINDLMKLNLVQKGVQKRKILQPLFQKNLF